jgi:hypothetical protein
MQPRFSPITAALPADEELGRINERLRTDLWREAHEARAELRRQMAAYVPPNPSTSKREDQLLFSAVVFAGCALGMLLLACWLAWKGGSL